MQSNLKAIRRSDTHELLHGTGLRCTRARMQVLSVLLDAGQPLTHAQISSTLKDVKVDRVTLYRTLTALEQAGLVHRVLGADNAWRFCAHAPRPDGCPGDHGHFLCVACGVMQCLPEQRLPWIALPESYRVMAKQLVAFGLCPRCSALERQGFARSETDVEAPLGRTAHGMQIHFGTRNVVC